MKQNRLSLSNSPYLQQHADNPVDWYEWSTIALEKATMENKPLLISIGYAACHWCHVMANESFSDLKIAEYMNKNFVCIKIDREERPDLDQIYMEAAHLVSGHGGWPLNAFAMPNGKPFYAATYFPPDQWLNILQQISFAYNNENDKINKSAESLTEGVTYNPLQLQTDSNTFTAIELEDYFNNHIKMIDFEQGGYAGSPKFMLPIGLEFFLRYYYHTGNNEAIKAVSKTLEAMAKGGIYDQLGGGFSRYSTDSKWLAPHFEKMLYDNAQLVSLYSKAYQVTKNKLFINIIDQTIEFVEREMLDESGGYYASIDADSEHEEGKFYVWSEKEIFEVLDVEIAQTIAVYFQITKNGNWEENKNILNYKTDIKEFAEQHNLSEVKFETLLKNAKETLLQHRNKRIRPTTDDKIICSWNALMLSAYINAYKATTNEKYLEMAIKNANFIEQNLLTESGQLFRIFKNKKSSTSAFLDDYSLTATAFLNLYETTFNLHWLTLSKKILEYVNLHFINKDADMYYYTSDLAEGLIARKYELSDNVIPASNSIMANLLYKMGLLFENKEYSNIALNMFSKIKKEIKTSGPYYANWALLACNYVFPKYEVSILGKNANEKATKMQQEYVPNIVFAGGNEENIAILKARLKKDETLIYLCKNNSCLEPTSSIDKVMKQIRAK